MSFASYEAVWTSNFSIGTTILQLEVRDNTGDSATASTYVNIREPALWEKHSPQLLKVTPDIAPTYGGILITIKGHGFYNNPVVKFGNTEAKVVTPSSNTKIVVECPPGAGNSTITVSNGFGAGTPELNFSYLETDLPPIKFHDEVVKDLDGRDFYIPELTSMAIGIDGRYYASSLDGFIYVLDISKDMKVLSFCKSVSVGEDRAVLGIAFHPADTGIPPKAFISTATLYWKNKRPDVSWNNGKIEVWQFAANREDSNRCMGHLADLVSGLPTSNHDHSVSAIAFMNNGDMLVSNAGTTNAGVHSHDDGMGGMPESPLSAAILRFKLSKGDKFDGHVVYDKPEDPARAVVLSGDVEVFSAGVRNCFCLVCHSNGNIYGSSNGANEDFGRSSKDCSTAGEPVAVQDALLNLKDGHYYGSPNRNRGRYDERQCSWVDPDEQEGPEGFFKSYGYVSELY